LELYYYKARFYDPKIRRFLNADPIGYADGMNMYAYVGGDPANLTDPSGMNGENCEPNTECDGVITTGTRACPKGWTCISGRDTLFDFFGNQFSDFSPNLIGFSYSNDGSECIGDYSITRDDSGCWASPRSPNGGTPARNLLNPVRAIRRGVQIGREEAQRTAELVNHDQDLARDSIHDAERHARWTYRMLQEIGPGWATQLSNLQEVRGAVCDTIRGGGILLL
jgi:hypothetical protein